MRIHPGIAGVLGPAALHGLFATVRFTETGGAAAWAERDAGRSLLFSLWHGHLLPLSYRYRRLGATALISRSRDGEYIARVVKGLGLESVRGSSSRGGSRAVREMVQAAARGGNLAVTPDGPRGPARIAKEGVVIMAQLSGAAIVPIAAGCTRAWRIESWDTFLVPKPLSTVHVAVGDPITVAPDADPVAALAAVQTAMDALTAEAEARAG